MTQRPAAVLGLKDHGLIREGRRADLVLFGPDNIAPARTEARYDLPGGQMRLYAGAVGMDQVFVGGVSLLEGGEHSGALPGGIIRPGLDTERAA